jgi:hypothetical protein
MKEMESTLMSKVAIVVLADTESFEGLGRAFNALEAVKELKEAGDDVRLIFDGAGTKWLPALSKPDHKAHALYQSVKDKVAGACGFCAGVFGVAPAVERCEVRLLGEYDGHPSFRKLVKDGYQVITF